MLIPYKALSPEALEGVLEEFVTRDGTDYGESEMSLVAKIEQVRQQVMRGQAYIVYCEEDGSISIAAREQLPDLGVDPDAFGIY